MSNHNMQAVENSLLPAVSIHGIPQKTYNLLDRMNYFQVPGVSIAVINNGSIEWTRGYGVMEMHGNKPVSPETLFQAASISKPVSALMALKLVEQGNLELDRDINRFLSSWQIPENEYTEKNKVTLRRLLSHTAGLTVHGFPGYAFDGEVPSLLQILNGEPPANTAPIRVDVTPGSMFRYSGGGYTVMQQVLEDLSGKPFDELLQTELLDPLNMRSSTFEQPLPMPLRESAATGHVGAGIPIQGKWHIYPKKAAAGLWTTPTDLANFAIEIMQSYENQSNKIISASMVAHMLTVVQEEYGLGFRLKKLGNHGIRFGHSGGNEGFRCHLVAYTGTGKGAVVMTNSDTGDSLMMEVVRSIANVYKWSDLLPIEKEVANQVNPDIYSRYVGKYQHPDYPDFVVQIEKDGSHLLCEFTPGVPRWEMYPESETSYFFVESEATVEFQNGADGIFDTLVVFSMKLKKLPN